MRKFSSAIAGIVACVFLMAFTSLTTAKKIEKPLIIIPEAVDIVEIPVEVEMIKIETKSHSDFLNAIGHRESGNRYDIVNTYGYMGRYQFGKATLKGLGYNVTQEEFLNDPELQEDAMNELLLHNRKKLRRFIDKYCFTEVDGVVITESGILAAAHLAGQGNVKKYFRKGYEFKDGYGTRLTSYLKTFSGYQLDLDEYK